MSSRYGTVVIADQHHQMLEGVYRLLAALFEVVVMVADEPSLFRATQELNPDLAIVDLSMPLISDSNDVLMRLHPELKIIVLSVYDEPTVVRKALDAGADGYVLKRSAVRDLVPAIHDVLQGRQYVSPDAALTSASPPSFLES